MESNQLPSTTLYAALKACGISNHDAACALLKADAKLAGRPVAELIKSKSQLSRRIVHATPGDIPAECFADFAESAPPLASRILDRCAVEHCKGDFDAAAHDLIRNELAAGHSNMTHALEAHGRNPLSYKEAITCIGHFVEADARNLMALHLMALVAAGCTGDGRDALERAISYALDVLGLELSTAETYAVARPDEASKRDHAATYGIARMRDGVIASGTPLHMVGPDGLVVGLLPREPRSECEATDVDHDVSLRHARLWIEDERLFVADLGSTNGTTVITGAGGLSIVAPPKSLQLDAVAQAVELHYGDLLCLGATTRYIVLPGMEPGGVLRG